MATRRDFVRSALIAATATAIPTRLIADEKKCTTKFAFKVTKTVPDEAFATWQRMRSGDDVTIIVGSVENLEMLREPFDYPALSQNRCPVDVVSEAAKLNHPISLRQYRHTENDRACQFLREHLAKPNTKLPEILESDSTGKAEPLPEHEVRKRMLEGCETPKKNNLENWPSEAIEGESAETVVQSLFNSVANEVHLISVPTSDWTTVPAHLRWGGWNAHPSSKYHVAAWRSWRDRYGAELVGMSHDTLILRVGKRPQNRTEALGLAEEQYQYCNDIVDQGLGSVVKLAAWLMATDAWYFWWD